MIPRSDSELLNRALEGDHQAIAVVRQVIKQNKLNPSYSRFLYKLNTKSKIALYFTALLGMYSRINFHNDTENNCDFLNDPLAVSEIVRPLRALCICGTQKYPVIQLTNCVPAKTLRDLALAHLATLHTRLQKTKTKVNIDSIYNIIVGANATSMRSAAQLLLPLLLSDTRPTLELIFTDALLVSQQKQTLLSEMIATCRITTSHHLLESLHTIFFIERQAQFYQHARQAKILIEVIFNISEYWYEQLFSNDCLSSVDKFEICAFIRANDIKIFSVLTKLTAHKRENAATSSNQDEDNYKTRPWLSPELFTEFAENRNNKLNKLQLTLLSNIVQTLTLLEKLTSLSAFLGKYGNHDISIKLRELVVADREPLDKYKTLFAFTSREINLKTFPAGDHLHRPHVRQLLVAINYTDINTLKTIKNDITQRHKRSQHNQSNNKLD